MNALAYMLDTASTNAHTVFKEIKHDIRTFDFIWQLECFLWMHILLVVWLILWGYSKLTKMRKVFKIAESPKATDVSMLDASDRTISVTSILHTNVCCFWWLCYHSCIEEIRGQEKYKENKNKLAKVKMSCKDCNNAVCKKHWKYICQKCGQD